MPEAFTPTQSRVLRRATAFCAATMLSLGLSFTAAPAFATAADTEADADDAGTETSELLVGELADGELLVGEFADGEPANDDLDDDDLDDEGLADGSLDDGDTADEDLGESIEVAAQALAEDKEGDDDTTGNESESESESETETETEQPTPDDAAPTGADYTVVATEFGDEFWGLTPEPVVVLPGGVLTFGGPSGFWTTGPSGGWNLNTYQARMVWAPPGYPHFSDSFAVSINADGSLLTATAPANLQAPEWADSPEVAVMFVIEVSDGTEDYVEYFGVSASAVLTTGVIPEPELPSTGGPQATLSSASPIAGGPLTVSGSGFIADEALEVWLHSTPTRLATAAANADGSFSATVTIPADTTAGNHRIEVRGAQSGSVWIAITVQPSLAKTGGADALPVLGLGAAALLVGTGLILVARRRQA